MCVCVYKPSMVEEWCMSYYMFAIWSQDICANFI